MQRTDQNGDELLSTTVAGERLGVTRQTVIRWIDEGFIAYAQVGSRYRIPASEVGRLLAVQPARNAS